jgi:hypothetical protein
LAVFCFAFVDYNRAKKRKTREEDIRLTLCDGNVLMYYDNPSDVPFNPFRCDKVFIRIIEKRDDYVLFDKEIYSQSYHKADKHQGTITDVMTQEELYNMLISKQAKLVRDYNNVK